MLARLLPVVKVGVRLGLCGGALYYTHKAGVWGNTKQGLVAYDNLKAFQLKDQVHSLLGEEVSSQLPELSLPEEISSTVNTVSTTVGGINKNLYSYYNCGVVTTLKGIQQLPDTVAEYSAMAVDKMKEAMK